MANDTYQIDLLATGGAFVEVTDLDNTGTDWLDIKGSYAQATDIRLNYSNTSPPTDAVGIYYINDPNLGLLQSTLLVHGIIENVRGCNTVDVISGNIFANRIYGDQSRIGIGGNDTLSGADGMDSVYGGNGRDVIYGGSGNDVLFGDAGADSITGDFGSDTIQGGRGADTLSGGDEVGDTVSYLGSSAAVRVSLTHGVTTFGMGGDAQGDSINNFRNITGSRFGDVLVDTVKGTIAFGYNNNLFDGGAGNDRIVMGGGNDTAIGGTGNDTLSGENGRDRLNGGNGNDSLSGGSGHDVLAGAAGADTIFGGSGADVLFGGSGNDVLSGGSGADALTGGAGADNLTGNSGADSFIFTASGDSTTILTGRDTITDFHTVEGDKINLHALDANTTTSGVNDDFSGITKGPFFTGNVAGALHYFVVNAGDILIEGDTDGDNLSNFAILVQGITTIGNLDFIF